jgi:tetratricopeptide (TPR) repeat protein
MQQIIERHGGKVEKFIGDAVMAVFGIPTLHEDDALRAVRAAAEIKERLAGLNDELDRERGLTITFRTGVHTGEVVAGDPTADQTLVTGDTVNTAARLEQAASPGEILLGEPTYRLTRDAVTVEAVQPISAKGKAQPVPAFKLLSVSAGGEGHQRRLDSPLAGRVEELGLLRERFDWVVSEGRPQLVTLLGPAGIGKSRLVAELVESVGQRATVLKGRCLPYGEGITYWPLREILHRAADIGERDSADVAKGKLAALVEGEADGALLARRTGTALGLESEGAAQEEIFWATRRVLESLARKGPLVTIWEDIHWAEPTLLDLLEYVLDLTIDSPILLICLARAELLEVRPGWGGNRATSTYLNLEPLADDAIASLLDNLPGGAALPSRLRARILTAAEGNALYLEEMLGMLVDEGHLVEREGSWEAQGNLDSLEIPQSVRALLASRIDALPAAERVVAKRASVVGRVFEAAAIRELTPEAAGEVGRSLLSLVRKELVRPERGELTEGDAFKFRHLLIRDAAYEALSKAERADLHERFGDWLERASADRMEEYQEIIGYHLEQAYRYRAELGGGESNGPLAERAADMLGMAGRRAHARADVRTTVDLLERAERLWPKASAQRLRSLPALADALGETGPGDRPLSLLDEGLAIAQTLGDPSVRAHLLLARRRHSHEQPFTDLAERDATEALATFEQAGDELGLASAWRMLGDVNWVRLKVAAAAAAWERSADHAAAGGDNASAADDLAWQLIAKLFGPPPAAECLEQASAALSQVSAFPAAKAEVLWTVSNAHAMLGEFEEAREALAASRLIERELGRDATVSHFLTQVAEENLFIEGQMAERIEVLREGLASFEQATGETNPLLAATLALALAQDGDIESAEPLATTARDLPAGQVTHVRISWQEALALCKAHRGAADEAKSLIDDALATLRAGEFVEHLANALLVQAEVLRLAGNLAEAMSAIREAQALYTAKGITPMVKRTGEQLVALGSGFVL